MIKVCFFCIIALTYTVVQEKTNKQTKKKERNTLYHLLTILLKKKERKKIAILFGIISCLNLS